MDRTPRRSSGAAYAHNHAPTPHTPAELNVVSKVAVVATAQDGVAKGILCLKVCFAVLWC
jgi:hypothetical protein